MTAAGRNDFAEFFENQRPRLGRIRPIGPIETVDFPGDGESVGADAAAQG
jgi:hypothetical protein